MSPFSRRRPLLFLTPIVLACREPPTAPETIPVVSPPATPALGFRWAPATPESQGMCGTTRQLGCTKTLQEIWNDISAVKHNTKRFIVLRNDRVIYDRGGVQPYRAFSASKGLWGAPTLVYAMSQCGVGLGAPASRWLRHGDGSRWDSRFPWTDITVEHLATHTSGVCDYDDANPVCRDEHPGWQAAYEKAKAGGTKYQYPGDALTLARVKAEQSREPARAPGGAFDYSNVGHALLNYVVQRACRRKLADIFDLYIKQIGMGSPVGPALIHTDDGQRFNQSTGIARWNGLHAAAVLRLASRLGIWNNQNVEPVRHWYAVTRVDGHLPAAAEVGWGVVYNNNSTDVWTRSAGHRRLSAETFGHGGNYSNMFIADPLTGTIVVRQGDNNANGASYLTTNGCAPGWTGTSPTCREGTDWSNNWNVSSGSVGFSMAAPREKVVEPLQEAFFFPPPFCRMISAVEQRIDHATDVYAASGAGTIGLVAEIEVDPREGAGSSVVDRVEFYKETDGGAPQRIGNGALVAGTSPARYKLAYSASSHGSPGETRTYFANCVAKSTQTAAKQVPSYSRPVRVRRVG